MWAVESGKIKPEIDRDVVYYRMASAFGFSPEVVDAMSSDRVESLLFLDQQVQIKEKKEREANK
jgi:hypothetical protein